MITYNAIYKMTNLLVIFIEQFLQHFYKSGRQPTDNYEQHKYIRGGSMSTLPISITYRYFIIIYFFGNKNTVWFVGRSVFNGSFSTAKIQYSTKLTNNWQMLYNTEKCNCKSLHFGYMNAIYSFH